MKKINLLIIFLLLFTSVNLIADVNIQNVPTFDDFLSGKKIVMKRNFMNNIFAVGTIVNFSGLSYEDVAIFGISIRFNGVSYKDVYLAGDSIEISGTINGNLRVIARQVNLTHLNVKGNVNITAPEVAIDDTVRCEKTTKIWSSDIQMGGWYNELHIKT
ncbi:MAG TPA: hypothetical protein PKX05_03785, partial [bacterium]|nr:hypothetical protein [bacterium]